DGLVLDALLGEHDPHACAVRAAVRVVERDHLSILASRPMSSAICLSNSGPGGSSTGDEAVRAMARTRAGSAPVTRATRVAFAARDNSSALFSAPQYDGTARY